MKMIVLVALVLSFSVSAKAGMHYLKLDETSTVDCRNYNSVSANVCTRESYGSQVNRWQKKNQDKEITKLDPDTWVFKCGTQGYEFYIGVWITYTKVKDKK